ncbi:response regulator [Alkalinema sp. FACHB-956]|uniref:response regulator n=1 Tax=Alkalinema sp. FACHB-956 TaxID=2692768 RepID=UPI001685D870|nr:response regulator [Alkalinema sp. FACHB-956]MBD2326804.1 response regulator [Alkalinema sp. FACHB-956]
MRILLVEDDPTVSKLLTQRLLEHHYAIDGVADGLSGWEYASTYEYDLLILNVELPQLDGISLCQRLRATGDTTPILLLAAQNTAIARITGLDAGADDYVTKPFDEAELIARIRALLRRSSSNPLPILIWGDLWLNPSNCEVTYQGQLLNLSAKEYALLELMLRESHHVFSNEEILESLWSSAEFPVDATVRSHIRRLRQKLTAVGAPPDLISTAHGRGYYLKPMDTPSIEESLQETLVPALSATGPWSQLETTDPSTNNGHRSSSSLWAVPRPPQEPLADRPNPQQQYQTLLDQIWLESQAKIREQFQMLQEVVSELQDHPLRPHQQEQANRAAHTLAGTLGTLGRFAGMEIARELEQWLHSDVVLETDDASHLQTLVDQLGQTLDSSLTDSTPTIATDCLLIVDPDSHMQEKLARLGIQQGLQTKIFGTLAEAQAWLQQQQAPKAYASHPASDCTPTGLILGCVPTARGIGLDPASESLAFLKEFALQYPTVPTVVLANVNTCDERLEIIRQGGTCILSRLSSPQSILNAVRATSQQRHLPPETRILLVDDDPIVLRTLTTQLQSLGLSVSTLNDAQQLWSVLETIQPDAVVLDIQMPGMSGLELCQVLRSDPRWQRLPVIFLTVFADSRTQHQAFLVGADDYLCKPVAGIDLFDRIFNRLKRVNACTQSETSH